MKITQESIILDHLDDLYPEWTPGYRLHGLATTHGWIGSRGERTARELRAEGKLEAKVIGKYVHYRVKRAEPIQNVLPLFVPHRT